MNDTDAIRLCAATAADAGRVATCVARAYRPYVTSLGRAPGPMHDDYAQVIRAHAVTLAVTAHDVLAGLVVLKQRTLDCLLDNVAVDPDFQGRGIGRRLIGYAEQQTRAAGYARIVLYTQRSMTENRARYAHLGFVEYTQVHEQGYERVYMLKALTRP